MIRSSSSRSPSRDSSQSKSSEDSTSYNPSHQPPAEGQLSRPGSSQESTREQEPQLQAQRHPLPPLGTLAQTWPNTRPQAQPRRSRPRSSSRSEAAHPPPPPPLTPAGEPSIRELVRRAATEVTRRRRESISPHNIRLPPTSDSDLWSIETSAPGPNTTGPRPFDPFLTPNLPPLHQQLEPLQPQANRPLPFSAYQPPQQQPVQPLPVAEPEILPPNLIWAPWGHIVIKPILTPLVAPNQYKLVSTVRSNQHGDVSFKIETMAHKVESKQIVCITEYRTANNVLLFSADGKLKDIPRTLPNLYPSSLLAWDMGISRDFRCIPEVALHNSRPASNFYRPSYIVFTRISCRPSNKRPISPQPTPPPHRPCPLCTLRRHAIVAAAEDFAITRAECINCSAVHYFQMEAKPSTVMSKRLFLRAIPTTSSSRVDTRATCIKTGRDFSHMEVRDTGITMWEVNQTTLSNLLQRYPSSPLPSATSPPQSPPSSRTESPPPSSPERRLGRPRRPHWQNSAAPRELSGQLRELAATDICQETMLDPNQSTYFQAQGSPATAPWRYGLVTTTAENPLQALRQGTILKPTGMMPILAGQPTTVAHPTGTKIAENTFVNHILPMKIDPETGYPEKVAGADMVTVERILEGEYPMLNAAEVSDTELTLTFGITPITQDHFSALEVFTAVVRETETIPLTPPEVRKVVVTHSGVTLLPERLCGTTAVTGRTKIPTLICRPETRWRCSSINRSAS